MTVKDLISNIEENLSKYDRNEVIRIVNDVDESHFWNKQELIEKLWYYGKN